MKPRLPLNGLCALALVATLSACASTGPRDGFAATDGYEPTSRVVHDVNVGLDRFVLRPVSQGYDIVTPDLFRHLISNGFAHIGLFNDFVNYVLQGNVDRALETFGRFAVNSLLGAGLLDPATEFGLVRRPTDFGLTLASHGVGEGTYVVLPLVGPSTARDAVGFFVDRFISPTFIAGQFTSLDGLGAGLTAGQIIDQRAANAAAIDDLLYNTDDSYVTLRAAYLQRRRSQAATQAETIDALPDIFDDEALGN